MKIRLSQLRRIIREAVREQVKLQSAPVRPDDSEADDMDEADMDEGWGDDTDYTGGSEGRPSGQDDRPYQYKKDDEEYKGSY